MISGIPPLEKGGGCQKQAIRINPNFAEAYTSRGIARAALKDMQGAIEDDNQAVKINPNHATAYDNRGHARYLLGDEHGAIAEGNQLLSEIRPAYEYKLVSDRGESRAVLMEALEKTQERLIIVCPWLSKYAIDNDVLQQLNTLLNHRNACIDIGWGHRKDWEEGTMGNWLHPKLGWKYSALPKLQQLQQKYPGKFRLKAMGTHEKFLVCNRTFAMLGSHNFLTSGSKSNERELGIRTTEPRIIQDLIDRFENAPNLEAQNI